MVNRFLVNRSRPPQLIAQSKAPWLIAVNRFLVNRLPPLQLLHVLGVGSLQKKRQQGIMHRAKGKWGAMSCGIGVEKIYYITCLFWHGFA